MRRGLLALLLLSASSGGVAEERKPLAGAHIEIIRYSLALRPDLQTGAISGIEQVRFVARKASNTIEFSPNALVVESATIDGAPATVSSTEAGVVFRVGRSLAAGRTATLRIVFSGTPKRGLIAHPGLLHTSYFACDWMFCRQDSPGEKARFDLDLYLPDGAASAAIGDRRPQVSAAEGLRLHRYRARRPYSAYLFGFAVGTLRFAHGRQGGTRFDYVGGTSEAPELKRLFAETPAIADFLSAKAGLPVPDRRYTQILVPGDEAQEAATLSMIGKATLESDFRDPEKQWVIVHEMAHLWWGNLVTCATWQDFWLNEGFATFMTAAWKQHRFGETAYQAELEVARRRLKRAADLGYDKPLAWSGSYPSLSVRRAIQYSKGALFLDHLRTTIGDAAFWTAVRTYTRRFAGKTVRSAEFERVMTESSGRDLSAIFALWVYEGPQPHDEQAAPVRPFATRSPRKSGRSRVFYSTAW